MKDFVMMAAFVLMACPRPQPAPVVVPPPPANTMPVCPPIKDLQPDKVCDAAFTSDGRACVVCPAPAFSCNDLQDQIYCVGAGGCLGDPLCHHQ